MIEYIGTIKDDNGKQYFAYINGVRTELTQLLTDNERYLIDVADNMEVIKEQINNALKRKDLQPNLL